MKIFKYSLSVQPSKFHFDAPPGTVVGVGLDASNQLCVWILHNDASIKQWTFITEWTGDSTPFLDSLPSEVSAKPLGAVRIGGLIVHIFVVLD